MSVLNVWGRWQQSKRSGTVNPIFLIFEGGVPIAYFFHRCSDDSRKEPCPYPHYRLCYNGGTYVDPICPPVSVLLRNNTASTLFYHLFFLPPNNFLCARKRKKEKKTSLWFSCNALFRVLRTCACTSNACPNVHF